MPRIRTLKPEAWESEKLGRLSTLARLNFIGLISLADDEGRGRGDNAFLKARLHPYAADVQMDQMRSSLDELRGAGLVIFYQSGSCSYYAIPTWTENQKIDRPSASKFPPPQTEKDGLDDHSQSPRRTLDESSLLDQGPGKGMDQGKDHGPLTGASDSKMPSDGSRNERKRHKDDSLAGFEAWYEVYPRKVARGQAERAWLKLNPSPELQAQMIEAVKTQSQQQDWRKEDGKWIPHPASWLNGERWKDQPVTAPKSQHGGKYDHLVSRA